jgi:hypothetical protein
MECSKYLFCGCSLEIKSDEKIQPEAEFSTFLSDFTQADYSIRVLKTDNLPEEQGEMIFKSDRRKMYSDNDIQLYTAYYNTKLRKYVDYACKINDSELYINYPDVLREVTIFECIDLPSMLLKRGIGIIHCSFIEYNGSAILFVGDKQVGKSTQAGLWEKHKNAEIINGDRAAVYFTDGKFYADGIPFCGTSKICKNKKVPIKALVCLSKGSHNEIKKLSTVDGFMRIFGKFTYHNTREYVEMVSSLAADMANKLPIFDYSCLKDESAVDFLISELSQI